MNRKVLTTKASRLAAVAAGFLLPAIAAKIARSSVGRIYSAATDRDPPKNPASSGVTWKEALIWSVVAGAVGAVARLATRRSLPLIGLPARGLDMEEEVDEIES